jgi:hypothetical protein
LPTWSTAQADDWLGRWAMNLMLINVSTRKLKRAVRLPGGDVPAVPGDGTSKSAASRRFVALSAERMAAWMASDLSQLDLLVIQIDGLHIGKDLVLVGALGIDGDGNKHPLGLVEGATENAAVVQALIDNLIERGLDPKVCRLFIVDGAKALTKAIRATFGRHTPIQRCQMGLLNKIVFASPVLGGSQGIIQCMLGAESHRLRVPRGGRRAPDVQQEPQQRKQSGSEPLEVDGRGG